MTAAYEVVQNERRAIRRHRIFRDQTNPFDVFDDKEMIARYRLSLECVTDLCDLLNDDLKRQTLRCHALPTSLQVFAAFRFFATGTFQSVVGDILGISKSSTSRCVHAVACASTRKVNNFIMFPMDLDTRRQIKEHFYSIAKFPNVLGAIDGTLILIRSPTNDEHVYVCRKGYHAINVQVVCDAKLHFLNIVVKWPGSTHDHFIFYADNK
ncbi:putative nuclease HARBI1 [Gigantopelta aegis]|uniref:putative nuclease HARBI1 n=1 Tax=Gigantopelta aegis TaxID=1735272 RepID=UPI001B888A4D|nr:putative nuclease HARBI1 [Gigantopelta aegis]